MDPIFDKFTDIPDDIFDWNNEHLEEFLFPKPKPTNLDDSLDPNLVPPILINFESFSTILKLGKLFSTCLKPKNSKRTFYPKRLNRIQKVVENNHAFKPFLPWILYLGTCSKDTLQNTGILTSECASCELRKYEK